MSLSEPTLSETQMYVNYLYFQKSGFQQISDGTYPSAISVLVRYVECIRVSNYKEENW